MFTFILHPERNKSLLRRHPWVFSKAIAHVLNLSDDQARQEQLPETVLTDSQYQGKRQDVAAGELCQVRDSSGKFMAWCHFSPYSQIILRVISFDLNDKIDYEFFRQRLQQAITKRQVLQAQGNDGVRLVAAEGDYLPGLIVDRYNNVISKDPMVKPVLRKSCLYAVVLLTIPSRIQPLISVILRASH